MCLVHIENVDLNLLKPLEALLEERHVSRAAARAHLSQSAMSRALARLRQTIGDELLVRAGGGYELTPRARMIQEELEAILPRVAALVRGGEFDPATATDRIRLACTDYASTVLLGEVFPALFDQAPHLSMTIDPLSAHTFDDLERGRLDLALSPVVPPAPLRWRPLFQEEFVCLLSRDHPLAGDAVAMADLVRFPHVSVAVFAPESMLVERRLLELGLRPPTGLRVPYFSAAVAAVPGTRMIATLPRRFAERHAADPRLRIAAAPAEFGPFAYGMVWHPRLDTDRAHGWVRSLVREAAIRAE
jgi:DNA-binding transcriptional LysR family regulator